MKKILVSLLAVAMASTMVFAFTGCGSSESKASEASQASDSSAADPASETADITGDWTLSSITTADGTTQTLAEYCAAQGIDSQSMEAVYTINADNTVAATIGGIGVEGTYTFDGTTLTLTFESGENALTYDAASDTLNASDATSGMTSVFSR